MMPTTTAAPTPFPTNPNDFKLKVTKTSSNCAVNQMTLEYCCTFTISVLNSGTQSIANIHILDYTDALMMVPLGSSTVVNTIVVGAPPMVTCTAATLPLMITEENVLDLATCDQLPGGATVTVTFNFCFDEQIDSISLSNTGAAYDPATDVDITFSLLMPMGSCCYGTNACINVDRMACENSLNGVFDGSVLCVDRQTCPCASETCQQMFTPAQGGQYFQTFTLNEANSKCHGIAAQHGQCLDALHTCAFVNDDGKYFVFFPF
jgi:hypothetical protein